VLVAGEVAVADITPDRLSAVLNGITTGALHQPGALYVDVVVPNVSVGATVSTTTFGAVPFGVTAGSETEVAVARTFAAALLYCPVAFAVKVTYPFPLAAVQVKLNTCVPVEMMMALVGTGAAQVTVGVGPLGVPAATAFTVRVGTTLVAVAGPLLLTVTDTIAISPAFM